MGIGSATGWKIPIYNADGEFVGKYVTEGTYSSEFVSFLNERNLRIIAEETDGKYFHYTQVNELTAYLTGTLPESFVIDEFPKLVNTKDMYHIYAWIAVGGFVILVLSRRVLL